jgi:hypothetical protein
MAALLNWRKKLQIRKGYGGQCRYKLATKKAIFQQPAAILGLTQDIVVQSGESNQLNRRVPQRRGRETAWDVNER